MKNRIKKQSKKKGHGKLVEKQVSGSVIFRRYEDGVGIITFCGKMARDLAQVARREKTSVQRMVNKMLEEHLTELGYLSAGKVVEA